MSRLILILVVLSSADARPQAQSATSPWGATCSPGSTGGAPDFSWAGYHGGESLPNPRVKANVREFGARGDGKTDDTAAFQRALDSAPPGALLVPRGRYRLTRQLTIGRSGLVLRGQGSGQGGTVLQFEASLADLQGLKDLPEVNRLSWSGGLIQLAPVGTEGRLTRVLAEGHRGEGRLRVADASSIRAGDVLFLRLSEDEQRTLERHLLGQPTDGPVLDLSSTCAARTLDWTFQVASVDGDELILSQPLRTDVRSSWSPTLWRMPIVQEVGIEHLAIEFPVTPYPGHHRERGFNAIDLHHNVVNAWFTDLEIRNCDSGIFVERRSKWVTIAGLRFVSSRPGDARGAQGHHGVVASACSDVLVTDLDFQAELVHELTISHRATGNVFAGPLRGKNIDLDHHRDAPFENLFQGLGGGLRLQEGGDRCYGPPSGARNTYWGLSPFAMPPWLGDKAIVGGPTSSPEIRDLRSWQRSCRSRQ